MSDRASDTTNVFFLATCSWNAGPQRQILDAAHFMSKTFSLGMVQEATQNMVDELRSTGNTVVDIPEFMLDGKVFECVFARSDFVHTAECLGTMWLTSGEKTSGR